jgi:hypothetical protein
MPDNANRLTPREALTQLSAMLDTSNRHYEHLMNALMALVAASEQGTRFTNDDPLIRHASSAEREYFYTSGPTSRQDHIRHFRPSEQFIKDMQYNRVPEPATYRGKHDTFLTQMGWHADQSAQRVSAMMSGLTGDTEHVHSVSQKAALPGTDVNSSKHIEATTENEPVSAAVSHVVSADMSKILVALRDKLKYQPERHAELPRGVQDRGKVVYDLLTQLATALDRGQRQQGIVLAGEAEAALGRLTGLDDFKTIRQAQEAVRAAPQALRESVEGKASDVPSESRETDGVRPPVGRDSHSIADRERVETSWADTVSKGGAGSERTK